MTPSETKLYQVRQHTKNRSGPEATREGKRRDPPRGRAAARPEAHPQDEPQHSPRHATSAQISPPIADLVDRSLARYPWPEGLSGHIV